MSQVLGGQFCLVRPSFDFQFESIEAASKSCIGSGKLAERAGDAGAKDAGIGAGEEPAGAHSEAGQAIAMATGDTLDDAVKAKAAELIGHPALGQLMRL